MNFLKVGKYVWRFARKISKSRPLSCSRSRGGFLWLLASNAEKGSNGSNIIGLVLSKSLYKGHSLWWQEAARHTEKGNLISAARLKKNRLREKNFGGSSVTQKLSKL